MTQFNNPVLRNASGEQTIKRYVHQPFTFEHNGVSVSITEHGKVILTKVKSISGEDVELESLEVSASLIFKTEQFLKATRQIKYLTVSEAPKAETSA